VKKRNAKVALSAPACIFFHIQEKIDALLPRGNCCEQDANKKATETSKQRMSGFTANLPPGMSLPF